MTSSRSTRPTSARRLAFATAALSAVAALTVGCTTAGPVDGDGAASSTTTIRSRIDSAPDSFVAFNAPAGASVYVNGLLYSTLVYQDENNEMAAGLAQSWEVEPSRVQFELRDDATCADGTPITPTVVKDSLDVFATSSSTASQAFGPQTPQITANDDAGTVEIALDEPWADVLQGVSLQVAGIVCPAGLADVEAASRGEIEGAFSGPYRLAEVRPGIDVTLELRDDFTAWPEYATPLAGRPAETVVFTSNADPSAVANALLTGELDIAPVTGKEIERFEADDNFELQMVQRASIFVLFNQREGRVFADEAKRRAVLQTIDQQQFIEAVGAGVGEPSTSVVPKEVPCTNTDDSLIEDYDPNAARAELDGLSFEMLGTLGIGPLGNPFVETALREAGAEPQLREVDNTAWITELGTSTDSWDLTVVPLLNVSRTMYGGMIPIVGIPAEDGGRNWSGTPKDDVGQLVATGMAAGSEEARCDAYLEAQRILLERADVGPIVQSIQVNVLRSGFDMRVTNGNPWTITMRITD